MANGERIVTRIQDILPVARAFHEPLYGIFRRFIHSDILTHPIFQPETIRSLQKGFSFGPLVAEVGPEFHIVALVLGHHEALPAILQGSLAIPGSLGISEMKSSASARIHIVARHRGNSAFWKILRSGKQWSK